MNNNKSYFDLSMNTVKVRRDPQGQLLNFADNSWVKIIIFPRGVKVLVPRCIQLISHGNFFEKLLNAPRVIMRNSLDNFFLIFKF